MSRHRSPFALAAETPRSDALFEREARITPGGSMRQSPWFAPHPPYASHGEGCWVFDIDGRRILDCANNFFSLVHGHAFPPVIETLERHLRRGTAFGMPTEVEIELAEALAARNPLLEQTRFCNSGTEAVMAAIKGARGVTGRHRIAKFEGCYHGAYDTAEVSLDPNPANWDGPDGNPASVGYAAGTPPAVSGDVLVLPYDDADKCAAILKRHGLEIAGVILDLQASRPGMVAMPKPVLDAVSQACQRDGMMLIVDEVVSFRLELGGAMSTAGIRPDFVALGKVIGGGLPVGAISGPASRMAVYNHVNGKPKVALGGTFSANPLTMAAGLAALAHLDGAAIARLNALGDDLRRTTNAAFKAAGVPAQLTGRGSLFRLHLKSGPVTGYRSAYVGQNELARIRNVHLDLYRRGLLLTPNCSGALSTPMGADEIALISAEIVDAVAISAV